MVICNKKDCKHKGKYRRCLECIHGNVFRLNYYEKDILKCKWCNNKNVIKGSKCNNCGEII